MIQLSLHLPYPRCEVNPEADKLSPREKQVMSLLAKGFRDRDIAQQLHISESTVKFHLNGTLAKLDAKNRYHAIYKATAQGLI